jgi:hypothetical protein
MRFGGYGNLPLVGQGAPYTALTSPTDEEATYSPGEARRHRVLTIEMIANDDVGAIRKIPMKLAKAAARPCMNSCSTSCGRTRHLRRRGPGGGRAKQHHHHGPVGSNLSSARLKMKAQTDMSTASGWAWPPAT